MAIPTKFNSQFTFNNTGSSSIYVANNSTNNVFGGLTTFNNTPTANTGIYVSSNSTGTNFAGNIVVSSANGQGVLFWQRQHRRHGYPFRLAAPSALAPAGSQPEHCCSGSSPNRVRPRKILP